MNNITEKVLCTVRGTIRKNSLLFDGDSVLAALSGGADSVCMLDVLCKLKSEFNISVAAAHLNHMIRGEEADSDQRYVTKLCKAMGVKLHTKSVNVPEIAKRDGTSEELAGRNARYDFFEELSKKHGYTLVATAHNRNDKAETVLMRIIRGTGIDGLAGIKYRREDGVIRPVLDVERADIEAYCTENKLEYCTDSTNISCDYTRNRIRNELIPYLEEKFNPSLLDTICSLADNARDDADFMNSYAERLYKRINSPMPKRYPDLLDIETLKILEPAICSRVIRIALKNKMGKAYTPQKLHVEAIKSLFDKNTGACVELSGGLKAYVKYGWIELSTEKDKEEEAFCYEIELDNDSSCDFGELDFEITEDFKKIKKNQAVVSYDLLEDKKLFVRSRKAGDRMVFFEDGRTRKIKDYFIDKKIPRGERGKIPLLCTDREVIAIIGHRISEIYKPNNTTKKGLVITYGQGDENR